MQQSDADLVAAASRGDLFSFGVLYERYYRMAVGIARSRLFDEHLAEDVAQETFAVACRALSTLENGEKFPPWLGTICRRTASRLAKTQQNHEALTDETVPTSNDRLSALQQHIHEVLEQLDETSREIVLLHYFSGLSYKEIADVVDLSTQAIHGRLQRARNKLATILNPSETKQ